MGSCLEFIVTICCKCDDGAIECLESELVHHDTSDVYGDIPPLDGCVDVPCFADDRNGLKPDHIGDVLLSVAVIPEMRRRGLYTTARSEEHTSELQSHVNLVCRLLL